MARAKIWTEEQFKGYSIQKYTDGCREEILEAIVKIFHFMWERCGRRLFVCHLTVFLPERFEANGTTIIRTALHSWRSAKLNRHIQGEYIWCREEGLLSNHYRTHYHIFIIVPGKYIQSSQGICDDLNRLLSYRTNEDSKKVHINPPRNDGFRWGKKVSEKLDNLEDAINWASYLAKISTKHAPRGQRTYSYSQGFLRHSSDTLSYSKQEEEMFDEIDLSLSEQDWEMWGPEPFDCRKELNFDPATGGPYRPKPQEAPSLAQESQEGSAYGSVT